MNRSKRIRNCRNFKGIDQDFLSPFRQSTDSNCRQCVYFSSRNCGMDVSDSIEPEIDMFS